jgi:hypothetical protein
VRCKMERGRWPMGRCRARACSPSRRLQDGEVGRWLAEQAGDMGVVWPGIV